MRAASAYAKVFTEVEQLVPTDLFLRENVEKRIFFKNKECNLLAQLGLEGRGVGRRVDVEERKYPSDIGCFSFAIRDKVKVENKEKVDEIQIYTDGSNRLEDEQSGAAFTVFNQGMKKDHGKFRLWEGSTISLRVVSIEESL